MGMAFARKKPYEYQGTQYAADIKDGDIIEILNEGAIVPGQWGERNVFAVKTRNGDKALALNQVSQNNLIEAFGEDTKNWIGKEVKVWTIRAMVSGKMQTVIYLSHPGWDMDEEGNFSANGTKVEKDDDDMEEIDFDEPEK